MLAAMLAMYINFGRFCQGNHRTGSRVLRDVFLVKLNYNKCVAEFDICTSCGAITRTEMLCFWAGIIRIRGNPSCLGYENSLTRRSLIWVIHLYSRYLWYLRWILSKMRITSYWIWLELPWGVDFAFNNVFVILSRFENMGSCLATYDSSWPCEPCVPWFEKSSPNDVLESCARVGFMF